MWFSGIVSASISITLSESTFPLKLLKTFTPDKIIHPNRISHPQQQQAH
jgi:hypothetical protein